MSESKRKRKDRKRRDKEGKKREKEEKEEKDVKRGKLRRKKGYSLEKKQGKKSTFDNRVEYIPLDSTYTGPEYFLVCKMVSW